MKINAKYFGSLSYDPEDLIYLPDGLFGFESYKNFLPLPFHETTDSLLSFQSTDDEYAFFHFDESFSLFPRLFPGVIRKGQKDLILHVRTIFLLC